VIESYPWTKQTHKPALLRLRPEDVGYDNKSGPTEEMQEVGSKINSRTAHVEKPADAESSLVGYSSDQYFYTVV